MTHRRFVLLGIGGVVALVVAITILGINDNLTYFLYPTEAVDQRAEFPDGQRFKLAGIVVEGSLTEEDDRILFEVTDGGATVPVVLTATPPPLFGEGVPVLLDGTWDNGVFASDGALVRHDENYEIPDQGGAHPEG